MKGYSVHVEETCCDRACRLAGCVTCLAGVHAGCACTGVGGGVWQPAMLINCGLLAGPASHGNASKVDTRRAHWHAVSGCPAEASRGRTACPLCCTACAPAASAEPGPHNLICAVLTACPPLLLLLYCLHLPRLQNLPLFIKAMIDHLADKQVEALKQKLAGVADAIQALRAIAAQGGEPAYLFRAYQQYGCAGWSATNSGKYLFWACAHHLVGWCVGDG